MRSSTDHRIKLLEFLRERDYILRYQNPDALREFLKKRNLPVPRSKAVMEITWHKSITAAKNLPKEYRLKSKKWLEVRGYHALDDGDLE
jgi:hypothetical protein